jgi:hypothetical protein
MNLNGAVELTKLRGRVIERNSLPALEVAKRVFEISARSGEPYENTTPEEWRKDWLASDRFVLAEIGVEQVGIPYAKKINKEKVRRIISASADGEMEPIVVDMNRQQIGRTPLGYVPKVIVVDGKHRHRGHLDMGKDRILAWVGEKAMTELEQRKNGGNRFVIAASSPRSYGETVPMSNLIATATLYSAVSVKPSSAITRQDTGDGGSRPTGGTQTMKWEAAGGAGGMGGSLGGGSGSNPATMRVQSNGARSSGSLDKPDPSDTKVPPDPSDEKTFVDPSDRLNWNPDKPQVCAPGCEMDHEHEFGDPELESPGSGVGPDMPPDWGAKNSEFHKAMKSVKAYGTAEGVQKEWDTRGRKQPDDELKGPNVIKFTPDDTKFLGNFLKTRRPDAFEQRWREVNKEAWAPKILQAKKTKKKGLEAGPIKVKKIVTKDKDNSMKAVAPPGRENQVKALKKKFGNDSAAPFKIAWSQQNKGD